MSGVAFGQLGSPQERTLTIIISQPAFLTPKILVRHNRPQLYGFLVDLCIF